MNYNIKHLSSLSALELAELSEDQFIVACWKNNGIAVLNAINAQTITPMTNDEFMTYCDAMGGDWGGMLLTGIKALYPEVYDAIPNDMGHFAWRCICSIVTLLGIGE